MCTVCHGLFALPLGVMQGRIHDDFRGTRGSIGLNYRTYSMCSDRQTLANSVYPYQTLQNATVDQGLHCLPLRNFTHTHRQ